jgi:hypothetical protein
MKMNEERNEKKFEKEARGNEKLVSRSVDIFFARLKTSRWKKTAPLNIFHASFLFFYSEAPKSLLSGERKWKGKEERI